MSGACQAHIADGAPAFVEASAPTDEALQTMLQKIIQRTTQAAEDADMSGYNVFTPKN